MRTRQKCLVLLFRRMAREFAKAFYNSSLWKDTVRPAMLKRDRYMCQSKGCYNPAEEVHHIIHLTEENINNPNITVNPKNLISLCGECHKAIHRPDKIAGLKKRASKQSILPEIEFDENGYPVPVSNPPGGRA